MGIELKGWYLLSREAEPSFRFKATSAACSEWDLLVCVPWHLGNVLSGTPVVHEPYVEQARYAADMRTYYWQHLRGKHVNTEIEVPPNISPYPPPDAQISDKPKSDGGNNFGRVARVKGLMTSWTDRMLDTSVAGIEARYWIQFLKSFTENADAAILQQRLKRILQPGNRKSQVSSEERAERILQLVKELGIAAGFNTDNE